MVIEFDRYSNIIDSRDIVERIDELVELAGIPANDEDFRDEREELTVLTRLIETISDYSDDSASDGITLIRDSYFEDYAKELAEEFDLISSDTKWPACCIDWEEAAVQLQADYTSVDFDGTTYWVR